LESGIGAGRTSCCIEVDTSILWSSISDEVFDSSLLPLAGAVTEECTSENWLAPLRLDADNKRDGKLGWLEELTCPYDRLPSVLVRNFLNTGLSKGRHPQMVAMFISRQVNIDSRALDAVRYSSVTGSKV
jgi:hypothetical protein